jgi:hypothetical protein
VTIVHHPEPDMAARVGWMLTLPLDGEAPSAEHAIFEALHRAILSVDRALLVRFTEELSHPSLRSSEGARLAKVAAHAFLEIHDEYDRQHAGES